MSQSPSADPTRAGKRAMVTGAASGIGAAVSERLARDGITVYAVDLNADGLAGLVASLSGAGGSVHPIQCDLSDFAAIEMLPTDVDILVNNAGIQHVAPIQDFPPETFDLIIALMLTAPFRLIRQSLPHMYSAGWGRIVNISSVHGIRASEFKSAYVTAKHGLEGLSKVAALEGAPHGVTSNCVNPAYVRTALVEKQIADQATAHGIAESEVLTTIMLGPAAVKRLLEPAEVADMVAFLIGPSSASITGSSFPMDGGWSAH